MAVLVLEPFPGECGTTSRGAQQKTAAAHIRRRPNQIANALETKHGVVNEERNRIDPMGGIGGTGSDERRHRPGFGNPLLEELAVGGLLIIDQGVSINRLVPFANLRMHAPLPQISFPS